MTPDGTDEATDTVTPSPWARAYLVVPLVASGAAVALARLDPTRLALGAARWVGLVGVAAGLGFVAWTVGTYSRAGETLSPVVGPDRLVTTGPLAYTRNPLYLGVVTAVASVAVLAGSPAAGGYAALLAGVYHGLVTRVEEPALGARFGDAYRSYRDRVPRWLPRRRD